MLSAEVFSSDSAAILRIRICRGLHQDMLKALERNQVLHLMDWNLDLKSFFNDGDESNRRHRVPLRKSSLIQIQDLFLGQHRKYSGEAIDQAGLFIGVQSADPRRNICATRRYTQDKSHPQQWSTRILILTPGETGGDISQGIPHG